MMKDASKHRHVGVPGGLLAAGLALAIAGCDGGGQGSAEGDASAGDAAGIEPVVETCGTPPENGAILARDETRGTGPHTVEVANGGTGNTIAQVRDAASNALVVSFYIAESQTAKVGDVPDGEYRIQYASGGELGPDCRTFAVPAGASQDPETVEFPAGSAMTLTYDLTPVAGGNFEGRAIDPDAFTAD